MIHRLNRSGKWNFKARFKDIDQNRREINPLINSVSIGKYIRRSFHDDDEEAEKMYA